MSFLTLISGILAFQCINSFSLKCDSYLNDKNIRLIIDYTKLKNYGYVIILDENIKLGCNIKLLRNSLVKFTENNLHLSMFSSLTAAEEFLEKLKCKASIVTFYKRESQDGYVKQANKITLYGEKLAWLIIVLSGQDSILDNLRRANLGLDADVIAAVGTLRARPEVRLKMYRELNPKAKNKVNGREDDEIQFFTPFMEDNGTSYEVTDFCNRNRLPLDSYCMLQIYKIQKHNNTSLVIYNLGHWCTENGTEMMKPFRTTEQRNDFLQFPLILGEKNASDSLVENVIEDDDNASDIKEFQTYFSILLNASIRILTYPKLGTKDANGEWTDLFGAVVKEEVDIALDSIIKTPERCDDMAFTHNILDSKRSIYIKPQESDELRDIFLVPFEPNLLKCVMGTCAISALVMTIHKKTMAKFKIAKSKIRNYKFSDSVMWSIGMLGQQGSMWKPGSTTERIIIIVSLMFTLVIYNSYSAFITSVLSIKLTSIHSVEDLLNSDYKIGYTKNSQDENYLRSMNITQLNEIYLRGYLNNNISNIKEGLLTAAKGKYGFFASSHMARRELQIISHSKCKYDISEIPIKYTVHYIAFPMSKRSPYRKLINLSLIKMYETGVYKHIYERLHPNIKKCDKLVTYRSARLPHLSTAFAILFLGIIFGVVILLGECFWDRRKKLGIYLRKTLKPNKPSYQNHFTKE